jgi:Ca-activated chloride channel family protein
MGRDCRAEHLGKALVHPKQLVPVLLILGFWLASASAQEQLDQAYVVPRLPSASRDSGRQVFKSAVDLVLVNVAVVDRDGRAVTGLQPADFTLLDDSAPQQLKYFWNQDEPLSLMVVLDASASMAGKLDLARHAVLDLVNASSPNNDFSLIVIGDTPRLALHLDDPVGEIHNELARLQPDGYTSLWDGMYLGMKELETARSTKRAMIVISDGGDNHSRYTEHELKTLLRESDVDVYAIGIFDRSPGRLEERRGPLQLDEITSATAGRLLSAHDAADVSRAVTQIDRELRNRYVLGYYPSVRARNGMWHKLKIRLNDSARVHRFRIYAKKGYFAPAE